jgi:hypothetical protein
MGRTAGWLCAGAALALLAGCGDPEAVRVTAPARPAGFEPERFPDIALPRAGYMYALNEDQLAMTVANGTIRRFEVTLEQRENQPPQEPAELLGQVGRDLAARGWAKADDHGLRWRKGGEELALETGRTDGRTSIRYRLRPQVSAGR